jgi:hypothetical protein
LDYGWKSESVSVDGRISWKRTNVKGDFVLAPAAWTGFIRPAYDWGGRLKAGLDCRMVHLPYGLCRWKTPLPHPRDWVDLGLFAEYRFTHRFGFWAKGGNLLNQAIQRTPLVAEAGMYFTAGILLNF